MILRHISNAVIFMHISNVVIHAYIKCCNMHAYIKCGQIRAYVRCCNVSAFIAIDVVDRVKLPRKEEITATRDHNVGGPPFNETSASTKMMQERMRRCIA